MILMIAHALSKGTIGGEKKVLILVPNSTIGSQFTRYYPFNITPDNIEVSEDYNFEDLNDNIDVVLVDEGDQIAKDWCLKYGPNNKKLKLQGLYSLKSYDFIMFSATFAAGENNIMRKLMDCNNNKHWKIFPSWC